jgi:hypothetical protein
MISQPTTIAANDERVATAPALSMPRVVATLQLLLAARRAARFAQQREWSRVEQDDIAA